ncbi:hypothetical protein B0H63DRAFT_530426 [Podospora didyma]|uniref:Uncharacterized protein n=1 Tax=Podospora didyma TaxID=330526 RepID=A0AAE0P3T9_9PEZI|nr:hypothetical protein B0H63DRAFT_530426 [Podospora didyma]
MGIDMEADHLYSRQTPEEHLCAALDSFKLPEPSSTAPAPTSPPTECLRSALQRWLTQDKTSRATSHLYYRLDNMYLDDSYFTLQSLAKRDMAVVEALAKLVSDLLFELFLAMIQKDEVHRPSTVCAYILMEENCLPQHDPPSIGARPPFYEGALLLVPRDSVAGFLLDCAEAPDDLTIRYGLTSAHIPFIVEYYANMVLKPENCKRLVPVLKDLCTSLWDVDKIRGFALLPEFVVDEVFRLSCESWICPSVTKTFPRLVAAFPSPSSTGLAPKILKAVLSFPDAQRRCSAILSFAKQPEDEKFELWARQAFEKVLVETGSHPLGREDSRSLVATAYTILGFKGLVTLLPILSRDVSQTSFMHGKQNNCFKWLVRMTTKAPDVTKLSSTSTATFRLTKPPVNTKNPLMRIWYPEPPLVTSAVDAEELADFVAALLTEKVDDTIILQLSFKITANADFIGERKFVSLWLPFLRLLIGVLEKHKIPLSFPLI